MGMNLCAGSQKLIYKPRRLKVCSIKPLSCLLSWQLTLASCASGMNQKKKINHIIVDEAHCISQWGRDFQSPYKDLSHLHVVLGEVPWYLMSAMLHSQVLQDALCIIGLSQNIAIYHHSNDRPNIHLCVRKMIHPITSCFDLEFLVLLNP